MFCAQRAVEEFLATLLSAFVTPSDKPTPAPKLAHLERGGIPVVSDGEFATAVVERDDRRTLLRGFLDSERREWP
jgi:hypothetical protein